jgi:ferredoxin
MPKVVHYRDNCIGCNSCCEHAPKHWVMDDKDGKSNLIGAENKKGVFVKKISQVEVENNKKAAVDCPVNIIKVLE